MRMPSGVVDVDVRLAIADDDHLVAAQLALEDRAQRLRRPGELRLVARPVLRLELAHELAHVARERPQLGHVGRARGTHQSLAAQQRAQSLHPAAPRQLRDDDRDQRDDRAERDEEVEQVALRLLAAADGESHVVHEDELGAGRGRDVERR